MKNIWTLLRFGVPLFSRRGRVVLLLSTGAQVALVALDALALLLLASVFQFTRDTDLSGITVDTKAIKLLKEQTEEEGRLLAPVPSDLIYEHTFPRGSRNRELEGSSSGDTNLVVPSDSGKFWPVHHAHLLVNNSVRGQIGFGELPRGEDGQFCRDVLWELGGVTYIPLKLSAYMSTRSTANSHSYRSCARAGLYKLKSKITFPKNSNRPY